MKLLLIDGHNLLFQMFFGMPNAIIGNCGRDVRGVVGFIGAVNRLIALTDATHCACLFDAQGHNSRCDILPEYKKNRPDLSELDQSPFDILPDIYAALDEIGVLHTEITDGEVDDVIAAYALTASDFDIVISSYDSDYFQLISNRVSVLRYKGKSSIPCDEGYMREKLGVDPRLYASYKSLVGDTADNIPGIRGIGPKTAARLVSKYGGIEMMLSDLSVIEEEKLRVAIGDNRELLLRNLSLIALDGSAPLPFPTESLKLSRKSFKTMDILKRIGVL